MNDDELLQLAKQLQLARLHHDLRIVSERQTRLSDEVGGLRDEVGGLRARQSAMTGMLDQVADQLKRIEDGALMPPPWDDRQFSARLEMVEALQRELDSDLDRLERVMGQTRADRLAQQDLLADTN